MFLQKRKLWFYIWADFYARFCFEDAYKDCFSVKLVFAPDCDEFQPALLGMSLIILGEVPTVTEFPASQGWSLDYQQVIYQNSYWKTKVYQTEPPFRSMIPPPFCLDDWKQELFLQSQKYRNFGPREGGDWYGYLFESSPAHSEKRRLGFLAFRGKTNKT